MTDNKRHNQFRDIANPKMKPRSKPTSHLQEIGYQSVTAHDKQGNIIVKEWSPGTGWKINEK
jgi:hypothetical protein